MAIRFCPSCMQNVVTEPTGQKCSHCGGNTKPVDNKLPKPEEILKKYTFRKPKHRKP